MRRTGWALAGVLYGLWGCGGGGGAPGGGSTGGQNGTTGSAALSLSSDGQSSGDSVIQVGVVTARLAAGTTVVGTDGQFAPSGATLSVTVGTPTDVPSGLTGLASIQVALSAGGTALSGVFGAAGSSSRQSSGAGLAIEYDGSGQLPDGEQILLYQQDAESSSRQGITWGFRTSTGLDGGAAALNLGGTGLFMLAKRAAPDSVQLPGEGFELHLTSTKAIDRVKLVESSTAQVLGAAVFGQSTGPVAAGPPDQTFYLWLERGSSGDTLHVLSNFANKPVATVAFADDSVAVGAAMDGPYRWTGGAPGALVSEPYNDCSLPFAGFVWVSASGDGGGWADYKRLVVEPLRAVYGANKVDLNGFRKGSSGGWYGEVHVTTTDCRNGVAAELVEGPTIRASGRLVDARFDAPSSIQSRIDAARDGDVIVVAPGTYTENLTFRGKRVTVRSENPSDPDTVARTIIEGGTSTAVTFNQGEGVGSVLDGFTIRSTGLDFDDRGVVLVDGASPTISHNLLVGQQAVGVLVRTSTGTRITGNDFRNHIGNAVRVEGGSGSEIRDNSVSSGPATGPTSRSALYLDQTNSCTVAGNTFKDNHQPGLWVSGGTGLALSENTVTGSRLTASAACQLDSTTDSVVSGNHFEDNQSVGYSACLSVTHSTGPTVSQNSFINNTGSGGAGLNIEVTSGSLVQGNVFDTNVGGQDDWGGAMEIYDSTAQVVGNTFRNNVAGRGGGLLIGVETDVATNVRVRANQFVSNRAVSQGGGIAVVGYRGPIAIYGNTFNGNQATKGGAVHVEYDNVLTGGLGGLWAVRHVPPGTESGNSYSGNSVKDVWFESAPDERKRAGR